MKKGKSLRNHKVQLAFGCAIFALLVVGGVSYRSILVSNESSRWVRHTHAVLESLQELQLAVRTVESGARGFTLTGKDSYLATYETAKVLAEREVKVIGVLTADNPLQQTRIPVLQTLTDQRIARFETVLGIRRTAGLDAAILNITNGPGQQIMADLEGTIEAMEAEERRLLVSRTNDARRTLTQTKTILFLGIVLGIFITGGAAWAVHRDSSRRELAEASLRESGERFRALANNISQLAWMADAKGYVFWFNDRWFEYTGMTMQQSVGGGSQRMLRPDDEPRVMEKLGQAFQTGEPWEDTFPLRGRDGNYRLFLSRAVPIRDSDGNVLRWFGTNTDITERTAMEEALFEEKERAQVTLNSIGDAVICTDITGKISFLNLVAEKMTGWAQAEAVGKTMSEVFRIMDATSREVVPNPMDIAIQQDQTMTLPLNCILLRRDGVETPIEDSASPIHDRQGNVTGAVIVFRDVSAAQAMALQMSHSARHDFLTGLPNRILLNDRVNQAIVLAPRHARKVAILFLDLDGFKHINDSLGHSTGDKLLQSVAARLLECVRGSDTVSRQGGDEFVVLLSEVEQAEDAAITARRILQAVSTAHSIDQHNLHVTTSIGVSVYPDDSLDAETLIKNADTAMYQAKENGRQSYKFFKAAMDVRAGERQSVEHDLRQALARGEFTLHYQPKISLSNGDIIGAEALLRWTHPVRGPVAPVDFIPVAEDSGLILPIGNWVLREACRQAQAWVAAGVPPITMAVNVSAMEFRNEHFLAGVFEALADTHLDPHLLELELTESVLMKHTASTENILKALRAAGIKIAIDDFGTGYSSLSYLRKFPVDALKIDQSFFREIETTSVEMKIVTAVISMGRSLHLRVIAEGVETPEQLAFLQAHGCDEAQGYYFGRPMPGAQFETLLTTGTPEIFTAGVK